MPRFRPTALLAVIVTISAAVPAAAQQPAAPLARLAFMSGCWRGDAGTDRSIEENWTSADSDVMLATTRYQDDNEPRTRGWEFSRIVADSAGIVLIPAPNGTAAGEFRLNPALEGAAFENPAHDFPKRVWYRRVEDGTLVVRLDGDTSADTGHGDREGMEFRLTNVACPTPGR